MPETPDFERDLARLVAACETGLDLPGVLAAAADAAGAALSAGSVSSYELSEQRDGLALRGLICANKEVRPSNAQYDIGIAIGRRLKRRPDEGSRELSSIDARRHEADPNRLAPAPPTL